MSRHYYLVARGAAEPVSDPTLVEADGNDSILVCADSEADALWLAGLYDAGKIDVDNVWDDWHGKAVGCLHMGSVPAAVQLGRKGGSSTSERKAAAARESGKKGGRPRRLFQLCEYRALTNGTRETVESVTVKSERAAVKHYGRLLKSWKDSGLRGGVELWIDGKRKAVATATDTEFILETECNKET